MRICILGDNDSAKVIRGYLSENFVLVKSKRQADYTIVVTVDDEANAILFDSVDGILERNIYRHVRVLTDIRVETKTAGGVQDERELSLTVPNKDTAMKAVEYGVLRGFLDILNRNAPPPGIFKRMLAWIVRVFKRMLAWIGVR